MASSTQLQTVTAAQRRTPSGPRGNFLFGSMGDMLSNSLGFIQGLTSYGDVAKYRVAHLTWYQVNHPDGIQRVLQLNNHNYSKGEFTTRITKPILGDSLFISEGESWLHRRRLMQPAFHKQRIDAFGDLMTKATLRLLDRWDTLSDQGKSLDVAMEMTHLTAEIVTEALFSAHVDDRSDAVPGAIATVLEYVNHRFEMPFYPPASVPTPRNRRYLAAMRTIDQVVYGIIDRRKQQMREGQAVGGDLLSMLMVARDEETGEGMNDRQLRDEVITMFVAGHETTATALAWTWYLLSQHPAEERRLHDELAEVLGGRTPTVADLPSLPYTRMVIEEAMRLYPPAWIFNREAVADDEICGYHIPAKAIVVVSPYVMHHHPAYWENAEQFDPDRFSPERSKSHHHYAYFPFGGGPRQCIGKPFAMVEAHLVLATIAQRYRIKLQPGHTVVPEPRTTLRPHGGLHVLLEAL